MSDENSSATKADLAALETSMIQRIEKAETSLIHRIEKSETSLREDMRRTETGLQELVERSETTLLREFRKWAISFESRFRANDALVTGFSERVTSLEERVNDIERRDRPSS